MDAATGVKTYERYKPWGDTAAICRGSTILPTRYQFTGQRREASLNGLYDYGARWYDSLAGVFLQPDSIIPDPYNPQDWDRYSYSRNNPIKYKDPTGHFPVPVDPQQVIRDAVEFLTSIGYAIVGDPTVKSINANGVDIVAQKMNEVGVVTETLLTEVKQTAVVNKSTLGTDKMGNLGGSIERALRTADRLKNSSNEQLQAEFDAIVKGDATGNLKNALYTTADRVSKGAKDVFNYVYMAAANGVVTTVKTAETIATKAVNLPFLAVPYMLIDPKNSPFYIPSTPQ